jgi:hypothetical protein
VRGILGQTKDLATASVAALVGGAVGRTTANLIPFGGSPVIDFAKGAAIAIAIRTFGEKLVGREMARFAAVGAMIGPVKNLVISFVPQAQAFLGAHDGVMYMPGFPPSHAPSLRAYSGDSVSAGMVETDTGSGLGGYYDPGFSAYSDY